MVIFRSAPSRVTLALITMGLVLGGCHSGGKANQSTPQATATPTGSVSSAPSAVAAADALAAYRGMWNAFVDAAKVPDPDAPALRRYAADDALRRIVSSLVADRDQGKVIKGAPITNPSVANLKPSDQPTEAMIADCVDDTNWLEYKKSGELWNNKPGGKHHTTATVKSTNGVWKVSAFTLEVTGTC
jgi:hypothetical protein